MKAQKAWVLFLAMALVVFGFGAMAQADNIAEQSVTFEVTAINEIEVSGNPDPLIINTVTTVAGSLPKPAEDSSTTYAITTNGTGKKITAKIDTNMPEGTTLTVKLAKPSVGTSAGAKVLTLLPGERPCCPLPRARARRDHPGLQRGAGDRLGRPPGTAARRPGHRRRRRFK